MMSSRNDEAFNNLTTTLQPGRQLPMKDFNILTQAPQMIINRTVREQSPSSWTVHLTEGE